MNYSPKQQSIEQMAPWFGAEEKRAVADYLDSNAWLTEFQKTAVFEQMIAEYVGSNHAVVVTSGTAALFCALAGCGIGSGDEVIVPDFTMIATANAVLLTGAKPVLVDISPRDLCMDLDAVERAVTKHTKALLLVSLNGRVPDMQKARELAVRHALQLIEDAAQSFGSQHRGKHIGTFGAAGIYSFGPLKIISTGQGGAVVTDDANVAERVRRFKDFGRERGGIDWHDSIGYNFKFTDLQAVIGIEQMRKLAWRVRRKKEIFALYRSELMDVAGLHFLDTDLAETTPWFVDMLADRRAELIAYLQDRGIKTRPFYPPVHSQPAYRLPGSYPVAEVVSLKGLWLPSSAFLTDDDIRRVCAAIRAFYADTHLQPVPKGLHCYDAGTRSGEPVATRTEIQSDANVAVGKLQLHLGCGRRFIPGFVHIDLADLPHIDYRVSIDKLPMFDDNAADLIYCCHALEYFDRVQASDILSEWRRVLKPGGILRLAVPDFEVLMAVYQRTGNLEEILGPLYGRIIVCARGEEYVMYHRTTYDYRSLEELCLQAGFRSFYRYDWRQTIHKDYDDFSQAYKPHMDKTNGQLISLNVEAVK